jgi:outer membrane protein TolC
MLSQTAAPQPGNVLTLDEALQIALENHPSIKVSKEQIDTQQAVVGQQMAAYYPLVNMTNGFQTGTQAGSNVGVTDRSFETYIIRTGVNMILIISSARETYIRSGYTRCDEF